MNRFRIGIDNYGLHPLKMTPLEILKWAKDHGAEGVAFSGLFPEERKIVDRAYLKDIKQYAAENDLYLEWGGAQHIPVDLKSWEPKDIFEVNLQAAKEAGLLGTRIVRSCSGGLMRWDPDSLPTEELLNETLAELTAQRGMLEDYNVILAIETHFEFTTFELARLLERTGVEPGGCFGICLDTMNLLTMLEDPVRAAERILPWIVSAHIKDGGLLMRDGDLISFTTEIGAGVVDFPQIFASLSSLDRDLNLNIEDHGGEFHLPVTDERFLREFPDLTLREFASLFRLERRTYEKAAKGECAIMPRNRWQDACEARMERNVDHLKDLLAR